MASRKDEKQRLRAERKRKEAEDAAREQRARKLRRTLGGFAVVAVVGLGAIFALNTGGGSDGAANAETAKQAGGGGKFPFVVGNPGPGEEAPRLRLESTAGGTYDLAARKGKTTLVYFHEGLMCQPCFEQIRDIEANWAKFEALGIDEMVAVSGDQLENLADAGKGLKLRSPLLSDPGVEQSAVWEANKYGMMGTTHNGHSFIVVDPEGQITWRADYGGKPKHTMFLPSADLLADMKRGLPKTSTSS